MSVLTIVATLILDGETVRLARNGAFELYRALPADAFGTVAYAPVRDLSKPMTEELVQILGREIEKNKAKMEEQEFRIAQLELALNRSAAKE